MGDTGAAFEVARRFIRQKKKLMTSKTADAFIRNVYLVLAGIKDAYMFENFSCSDVVACELVASLRTIFGVSKQVLVIIMETLDVIVTLEETFSSKRAAVASKADLPVIIDVNRGSNLIVHSNLTSSAIWDSFVTLTTDMHTSCTGRSSDDVICLSMPPNSAVGSVLFAGWCLGYPFVYEYTPSESAAEVGCTALAMQPLLKVSVLIDIPAIGAEAHPLMEFSLPVASVNSCLLEMKSAFDSIESVLDKQLITTWKQQRQDSDGDGGSLSDVKMIRNSIRYQIDEFQLPHIML